MMDFRALDNPKHPLYNLSKKGKSRLAKFNSFNNITGKRIMMFASHGYDRDNDGRLYIASEGWLGENEEGIFGHIYGGSNGYSCFISWVLDAGVWAFNPVNIKEYRFCKRTNAFLHKDHLFRNKVCIEAGSRYVFVEDDNDKLKKLVRKPCSFLDKDEVIWQR